MPKIIRPLMKMIEEILLAYALDHNTMTLKLAIIFFVKKIKLRFHKTKKIQVGKKE